MNREITVGLRNIIKRKHLDMILIKNSASADPNFFYVTGIDMGEFPGACLIVYPNKMKAIVSLLDAHIAKSHGIPFTLLKRKMKLPVKGRIGINYEFITKVDFDFIKARKIDISKDLGVLRSVKTKKEITTIKKSCDISSKIMEEIADFIKPGLRENEIAGKIEQLIIKNNCCSAFHTIVASGANSANAHHSTGNKKIKKGELIVVDFGAAYRKYCSDITRTFIIGKPNKKQASIYQTVKESQQMAFDQLKAGNDGKIIYESVKDFLDKKYPKRFIHGLGHGLGLEVHDFPADIGRTVLKENMVFTIEPGIYMPHLGGVRIEDDMLITKNGFKKLTNPDVGFVI
ncbi:MAG: Xaa-Pro peptidase family protein [Candidatus Aenigmatarchaeota archaeon]